MFLFIYLYLSIHLSIYLPHPPPRLGSVLAPVSNCARTRLGPSATPRHPVTNLRPSMHVAPETSFRPSELSIYLSICLSIYLSLSLSRSLFN